MCRGKLSLGLLPSSSMRIIFAGDDGHSEQLALLNNDHEVSEVCIEEISADNTGRSFLVRVSESKVFYYWCAEKSKRHGMDLLAKMKNLLLGRPTLSDLTGISDSRLDAFVTHLHAYLLASSIGDVKSLGLLNDFLSASSPHDQYLQPSSVVSKSSRFRTSAANAAKASSVYQTSLSPRSGAFKDGVPRMSCAMIAGREKLKRRGDWLSSSTGPVDTDLSVPKIVNSGSASEKLDGDCSENSANSPPLDLPLSFPLLPSLFPLATQYPLPKDPSAQPFKPYYCWCPPCPSSLQYSVTPLHMPVTSVEPLPLPPLSSLLSNDQPPTSTVSAKMDKTDLPSLNLPSILHDPLLHLPLPTSPLVSLHGSQVPTFTPLMSDPIVHVPVIDVCSSGQAYLVSCGPSMSSTVPLLPSLKPLIPETESLVERSARETLMRLIASTPSASNPQLVNILPAVLTEVPEKNMKKHLGVHPGDTHLSSSCSVNEIGPGVAATEDEASVGDGAHATLAEYDDNGDPHHFQSM
ncbi:hypothetical protein E2562_004624 [Oryza meyeriana var. granulata]|uniref:Uncharacterized protein n=1 Tax=Oryza meyeriana var. granulata TaxID=110450 RepID=A0A6G1F3U2_9ORYZ|nr:hypothetical protein E2562_004624 [Oryza meyeriana var. granulata]KAF0931511.1 hypothetical protein E2562_004624 [Oryza meyeriana var. granulata]